MRLESRTPDATREIGARFGRRARTGEVIALYGALGVGKTCLIQGVAAGLGVTGPVASPTFILIAEYAGRLPLYHVDLYRTASVEEIRALGLDDLLGGDGVVVIEWAEKAEPLLPPRTIRVRIEGVGEEPRTIEVDGTPPEWSTES